jgi:hypothetical protein
VAGQLPTGRPQKRAAASEAAAALRGSLSAGGRGIAMVPRARARWAAGPITVDGSLCRAAGLACQARRALAWAGSCFCGAAPGMHGMPRAMLLMICA